MSKREKRNSKFETPNAAHNAGRGVSRPISIFDFRFSKPDFRKQAGRWTAALVGSVIGLLAASPILAQGCALCYNTAAAASSRGIAALRHGVLILMLPPVVIFGVVTFFTVRGRNRFNDEAESFEEQGRAA